MLYYSYKKEGGTGIMGKGRTKIIPIQVEVPMDLKTINFYLVQTANRLMLVDAGYDTEQCWEALLTSLEAHQFRLHDLSEIVLTHNHIDHVGLVNRIIKEHPIPVYAHQKAIPRLKREPSFFEMRIDFFQRLYEQMDCGETGEKQVNKLREAFEKNRDNMIVADILPLGRMHGPFQVIEVPGHAPDQVAFYLEEEQVLIGGDLLIGHISSNAIVEPDEHGNRLKTLIQHYASLEKIGNLPLQWVYSGHGRVIDNPKTIIIKRLNRIKEKAERFKDMIEKGHTTANSIAKHNYKQLYYKQFSLVMSEVIGHLDWLEEEGKISKTLEHEVWQYFVMDE